VDHLIEIKRQLRTMKRDGLTDKKMNTHQHTHTRAPGHKQTTHARA
jgi:hypothetical protein